MCDPSLLRDGFIGVRVGNLVDGAPGITEEDLCFAENGPGMRHQGFQYFAPFAGTLVARVKMENDGYVEVRQTCSEPTFCADDGGLGQPDLTAASVAAGEGVFVVVGTDTARPQSSVYELGLTLRPAFAPWGKNQPNDADSNEDCLAIHIDASGPDPAGSWGDDNCSTPKPFVCEAPAFIPPFLGGCATLPSLSGSAYVACPAQVAAAAASTCASEDGQLAVVESAEENAHLVAALDAFTTANEAWIGGSDVMEEGVWKWVNGASLYAPPFSAWADNQPDDGLAAACLVLNTGSSPPTWQDAGCETPRPYICEVPAMPVTTPEGCSERVGATQIREVCTMPLAFVDAQLACGAMAGHLAHVSSWAENLEVGADAATVLDGGSFWIGGSDQAFEDLWVWSDDGALLEDFY